VAALHLISVHQRLTQ